MSIIIGCALGLTLAASVGVGISVGNNREYKETEAASQTATFTASNFSGQGTSDTGSSVSATVNNVTFSCDKAYGTTQLRCYKNSTITISSSYTITSLAFTFSSTKYQGGLSTSYTGLSTKSWSKKLSSGQARFTKIIVTYDDSVSVSSIAIDGNLSKTSYTYGEAWSHSGLSVVATYSDSSTATITSGISWSYSPSSTATIGTNSLTITATVDTFTATHTESVTVSKVASPYLNGVAYQMSLTNTSTSTTYYFIGSMSGYYGATTDDSTSSSIVNVYFEPNGDGQNLYFYSGNDTTSQKQYIYISINDTHVNFTYGTSVPSVPWYYNGSTIAAYVSSVDSIYGLGTYGTYVTFGAIGTYNTSNYFAQFTLAGSLTAENFATQLLTIIACDSTGATAPTLNCNYTWNDLSSLFSQLDSTEQSTLQNATANESGTTVEQAMARYDYVVAKYSYNNFINRTISNSANRMSGIIDNNSVVMITIIMGLLATTGFAAFYMLRKKKIA